MIRLNLDEWLWMLSHWRRVLAPRRALRSWGHSVRAWHRFWESYHRYVAMVSPEPGPRSQLMKDIYPCVYDATVTTEIEPTYFYQDAWAFEHIVKERPPWHVDIGSHHKYVALLSKVVPVTMVDIRPLSLSMSTIAFREGSILDLPYDEGSVPSVSSLCVVEHIGLGRYGDPLDPHGTEKAIAELKRIVAPGGCLYVSLPLNDQTRTYFNAHRALSESYFLEQFDSFELLDAMYLYSDTFTDKRQPGFGVGCFKLRRNPTSFP